MSKKKCAEKPRQDVPHVLKPFMASYAVGSGITKQTKYRFLKPLGHNDKPENIPETEWTKNLLDAHEKFDPVGVIYSSLEETATKVLEDANLPATEETLESFLETTVPGMSVLEIKGPLVSFVEAKGYKERIDREWYATKILSVARARKEWRKIGMPHVLGLMTYEIGMRVYDLMTFKLGMLVSEMKSRGFIADVGRKGGIREKGIPELRTFIRSKLKKNKSLTVKALWEMVPEGEDYALKEKRKRFFREDNRLYIMERPDGKNWERTKNISEGTFKNYVSKVRRPISA